MRERVQSGAEPTLGEYPRMEPECDLPQPVERCREPFGDVGQLVSMPAHLLRHGRLRRTYLERQRHELLLRAVVQVPLDPLTSRVGGGHDSCA